MGPCGVHTNWDQQKKCSGGEINGGHEWSHGVVLARNTAIFQDEVANVFRGNDKST